MGRIAGVTSQETRDRLLAAAARVFELKGYEGATIALIAAEAGVSSGAIYAHYDGKAELLVHALEAHREQVLGALLEAPDAPASVGALLTTLGLRLGNRAADESALLLEAMLAARRDPELARVLADALSAREQRMSSMIHSAQVADELTPDVSAEAAARFALMLGLGSIVASQLDLPAVDPDDWASFIRRFIATYQLES